MHDPKTDAPEFEIRWNGGTSVVRAWSPSEAVEEHVRDRADKGSPLPTEVSVRGGGQRSWVRFTVATRTVLHVTATEIPSK